MDEEDPRGFNRNKRKFEDEILEVRVGKQPCLSAKDSNTFLEDADSVMSVFDDFLPTITSASSSVNWSGTSGGTTFGDCEISSSEYESKQLVEDFFCSNGDNSVLSSGRWNVNQADAEQGTEKLTIDKEFEQYFSMLML